MPVPQPSRHVAQFLKKERFDATNELTHNVVKSKDVLLCAFVMMPNHFHLLVKQLQDDGISKYMMRVLSGYAKYFNAKYEQSGRLFESEYRSKHIKDNRQFLHTSAYIHRNPREMEEWRGLEDNYYWSSMYDYVSSNRWGDLLDRSVIFSQFNQGQYKEFVETSTAKERR